MISKDRGFNSVSGLMVLGTIFVLALPQLVVLMAAGYAVHKYSVHKRTKGSDDDSE